VPSVARPYLRLEYVTTLDSSLEILGSDSPTTPPNHNNYFVTRDGKVYRYDSDTMEINVIHIINPLVLDTRNNKGLYDIAFHLDFAKEKEFGYRKLYLHYAVVSDSEEFDHYNVIAEYRMDGLNLVKLRDVKKIPQTTEKRSGGWVSMHLKEFTGFTSSGDNWLYFATGGNVDESVDAIERVPFLSTVWGIIPDRENAGGEPVNRRWASGIKNPISCDASWLTAGWFYCLLEDATGNVVFQRVQRGFNYGSQDYVNKCRGRKCESERNSKPERTLPLATFPNTDCPVRSLHFYTGKESRDYKLDKFLVRSACYLEESDSFKPFEIMHFADSFGEPVVMPMQAPDNLLVNTTLIGADMHNDFFVAGYSPRDGRYNLYRIYFVDQ